MFLSPDEQIIIAQCTPRGSGALALLRISGTDAISLTDRFARLSADKTLEKEPSHTIQYGRIVDTNGQAVDEVLFLLMRTPKTFTGQDTVEITCHNNQFIIEQIIQIAIAHGARLAQEGEFTKRSVLAGKIDLVQAEAINELIHAQTQMALKKSLEQLGGSLSAWLVHIEQDLLKAVALSEASFEFLDEEMEFASDITTLITTITSTIASLKKTFSQQQQIRQGIRIVLIGAVNAGKSSLFNALLNQERAIVNEQAGTTRDVIEAGLYKQGNYWTLVDTAGLRQTDDSIEQEGIARSFEQAHQADIILLTCDSSRIPTEQEKIVYSQLHQKYESKIITTYTKSDTSILSIPADAIAVSSKNKSNITLLEQALEYKIATLFNAIESPFLLNQRQFNLLLTLENKLMHVMIVLNKKPVAYELLSIHLQECIAHLCELSGKTISEAGMDMVFREFCVGK